MVHTEEDILRVLSDIPDPEIPVISITDLGIVRSITIASSLHVIITITPTYSGCPAMKEIENDIVKKLKSHYFKTVEVKMIYQPAWTTDWMTDTAKEKLKKYGIAPPTHSCNNILHKKIQCPRCASKNTKLISQFGSTACKALYQCVNCLEPFDYFKCI